MQYSNNPNYIELVSGIYKNLEWYFKDQYWQEEKLCHANIFHNLAQAFEFKLDDLIPVVYFTFLFTIVRYAFENFISKVKFFFDLNLYIYIFNLISKFIL